MEQRQIVQRQIVQRKRYFTDAAVIWLWGTATAFSERVTTLIKSAHHESAEFVNVLAAAAWFFPCVVNPHFLQTSIYVQEIASHISQRACLCLFGFLFAYWLSCLIVGSPEPLVYDSGRLRPKTIARLLGFAAAVLTWTTFATILTSPGMNPGTFFHGGFALWSGVCWIQLALKIIKERTSLLKRRELCRCKEAAAPLPAWARNHT